MFISFGHRYGVRLERFHVVERDAKECSRRSLYRASGGVHDIEWRALRRWIFSKIFGSEIVVSTASSVFDIVFFCLFGLANA